MKILLAVDGSECSLDAVDALIAHSRWFAEPPTVVLAYVHPPLPYPMAQSWVGKETVEKYYHDEADAIFAKAAARLEAGRMPFERAMLVGDAAQEIGRHAVQSGCDLIALGRRGHTALANLVLGSVAMKVLASSTVPVLFPR
jgi:nucleotide-binding universal stress UspA family protein